MKIHSPGSEYHICSLYVFVIILVDQLLSLSVEKTNVQVKQQTSFSCRHFFFIFFLYVVYRFWPKVIKEKAHHFAGNKKLFLI